MARTSRGVIRYKLGLNQPADSPTAGRMAEMAEAINRETDGAFRLEVHPESRLGPDPQMFADVQKAISNSTCPARRSAALRRRARCR
jgi:TRAP-type C4-dicarboxylate transport system substrate-binding protein